MNKEQFLAMSLPYKLKFIGSEHSVFTMDGFYPPKSLHFLETNRYDYFHFNEMPILHPLSDLTKPITHNGETFVPIEMFTRRDRKEIVDTISYPDFDDIYTLNFYIINYFVSWHFDIANLIEKGEAIDVNTLQTNPYA